MSDQHQQDGWTEYRIYVTALLERHDEAIDGLTARFPVERELCTQKITENEAKLRDLIDAKFVQLGQMHADLLTTAKDDLVKETTEVKVAKITSRWEFWGVVILQIGAIATSLIALLSK